jgi:putative copper export protein
VSPLALAGILTRLTLFAAVLVATGAAAFRFLVLARLAGEGAEDFSRRAAERAAQLGRGAALLALAACLARFPVQLLDIRDPESALGPQARALALHTFWGEVWLVQLLLAALVGIAYTVARRGRLSAWSAAAAFSILLAWTPALSGHAIGSERLAGLAVLADGVHVLAAGAWLGALLVLLTALALRDEAGSPLAGALVASFSPLALSAAAAALVTGAIAAWLHLGAVSDLWRSRYGQRLLFKLGAVGLMALCGLYNWRRAGPALQRHGDAGPIRRSARAELVIGALVLLITTVLVVTPPPGDD